MTTGTKKKPKQPRKPAPPQKKKKTTDKGEDDRRERLGTKHVCFSCKTRFYDLNKPAPICPKCGADQRTRPREEPGSGSPPPPAPAKRAQPRPVPPSLLEDDDEAVVPFEEEMDLDLGDIESGGDELFEDDAEPVEAPEDDFEDT